MTVCYGTDLLISMHALQTGEFSLARAQRSADRPQRNSPFGQKPSSQTSSFDRQPPTPVSMNVFKSSVRADLVLAKLLNMSGKLGTIASGAFADMIVLEKNPLEDITVLDRPEHNLVAVIKEGRLVSGRLSDW